MHVHDGLAPVEFLEDRVEAAVAQVDAGVVGEQRDPVGAERVERVGDLASAPSTSGSGSVASSPNRWEARATQCAPNSFSARTIRRLTAASPNCSGTGTESSAAAISCRSIMASESSSVHAGSGAPPILWTPTRASCSTSPGVT
jgi:hypothetical protein